MVCASDACFGLSVTICKMGIEIPVPSLLHSVVVRIMKEITGVKGLSKMSFFSQGRGRESTGVVG